MGNTTIQVKEQTRDMLKQMGAGTYDEAIRKAADPKFGRVDIMTFPREPGYKIPSLKKVREKDMIKFDGVVTKVTMSFPSGANSLVDVRVLYKPREGGTEYVVPTGEDRWIAKDDTTVSYSVGYKVEMGGEIEVQWRNTDSDYDHNVAVEVVIKETPAKPLPVGGK